MSTVLSTESGPARLHSANSRAPHEKHTFYAVNLHSPRSDQTGAGFKLTSPGWFFLWFSHSAPHISRFAGGSRAPVTMLRRSSRDLKTCQLLESPAKLININYAKRDESTVFSVGRFFCSEYQAGGTSCVTPPSWQILIVGRSAN